MNKSITRRVLAIMGGVCYFGTITYLSFLGISEALSALIASGSLILGFYFGTKAAQA